MRTMKATSFEAFGPARQVLRVGERVWVYQAQHGRHFGTAAEFVAIDAARAAPLPAAAGFEVGSPSTSDGARS